jgi:hypothetical protein
VQQSVDAANNSFDFLLLLLNTEIQLGKLPGERQLNYWPQHNYI